MRSGAKVFIHLSSHRLIFDELESGRLTFLIKFRHFQQNDLPRRSNRLDIG